MLWTTIETCESLIKLLEGYHMIAPPRPSMISAHVPVSATLLIKNKFMHVYSS